MAEETTARPCHSRWHIHSRVFKTFAITSTRVLVELGNVLLAGKTSLPKMTYMTDDIPGISYVNAWSQENAEYCSADHLCLHSVHRDFQHQSSWPKINIFNLEKQKTFLIFQLYHNIMKIEFHNKVFHLFTKIQGLFSCSLWICHCPNKNMCFAHFPIDYRLQEAKTISVLLLCYILSTSYNA